MNRIRDRTGERYENITVLRYLRIEKGRAVWLCKCELCGREFEQTTQHINQNKSCGCYRRTRLLIHGQAGSHAKVKESRLYTIWTGMKNRCNNPKVACYSDYGGKGVHICREWADFRVFNNWAHAHGYHEQPPETPAKEMLTIDRINSNGNYEPANCRWITKGENSRLANIERFKKKNKMTLTNNKKPKND